EECHAQEKKQSGERPTLPELEKRLLALGFEPTNVFCAIPQQSSDVFRRAVANPKPHDFGRRTSKNAEAMKILVFGHQHTRALARKLPDGGVGRAASVN